MEIRLERTGQAPLAFEGELLKAAAGRIFCGKEQNRWHEITLYRTAQTQRLVLSITYRSQWQGEAAYHDVCVLSQESDMIAVLRNYNPLPEHIGYPDAAHFRPRQLALEADIRRRFSELVEQMLSNVSGAEERIL